MSSAMTFYNVASTQCASTTIVQNPCSSLSLACVDTAAGVWPPLVVRNDINRERRIGQVHRGADNLLWRLDMLLSPLLRNSFPKGVFIIGGHWVD